MKTFYWHGGYFFEEDSANSAYVPWIREPSEF